MKHKRKGSATAVTVVFVAAGLLSLVLGARQVYRFSTAPVWVASSDLAAGQVITPKSLTQVRSAKSFPGRVENPSALIGKRLRSAKARGGAFYPGDFRIPAKSWLAQKAPEGRVLYTLVPRNGSIPHTQLRNGDRLDVLVKEPSGVRTVARDVRLMGALAAPAPANAGNTPSGRGLLTSLAQPPKKAGKKGSTGTPLVIAVHPQEVYPLASIGDGESVTLVLHGEQEVKNGRLLTIDPVATHRRIEVLNGLDRKNVLVRR